MKCSFKLMNYDLPTKQYFLHNHSKEAFTYILLLLLLINYRNKRSTANNDNNFNPWDQQLLLIEFCLMHRQIASGNVFNGEMPLTTSQAVHNGTSEDSKVR